MKTLNTIQSNLNKGLSTPDAIAETARQLGKVISHQGTTNKGQLYFTEETAGKLFIELDDNNILDSFTTNPN